MKILLYLLFGWWLHSRYYVKIYLPENYFYSYSLNIKERGSLLCESSALRNEVFFLLANSFHDCSIFHWLGYCWSLPQTIRASFYTPHSGNAFLKTLYFKTGLTLYLLIMIIQVQQLKYGATFTFHFLYFYVWQGCISCGILVSGIWARGVSSEHMENMEMFSCSPT